MTALFAALPALIQAIILFCFALVAVFTVLSGIGKTLGMPRMTAFCAALGQDFGKAGAVLQGHLPVNKPLPPVDEETCR